MSTETLHAHEARQFDFNNLGALSRSVVRRIKLPLSASGDGRTMMWGVTLHQVDAALKEANIGNRERIAVKIELLNSGIMIDTTRA
jgi:hypothetical protein